MPSISEPGPTRTAASGDRTRLVERLMEQFPHVPREAVLKEDLLRGGMAFDDSALSDNEHGDVKPKSYFIFSFDHGTLPELGAAALRRPPEEIVLTGGPYDLRRTVVSVRVNPASPYRVAAGPDGVLGLYLDGARISDVGLPPMPDYYRHALANGKSVMEVAPTIQWGYLIYLTVFRVCQYFGAKEECQYCDINHNWRQHKAAGRPYTGVKDVEEVLEALEIIDRHEVWDRRLFELYCPGKERYVGRDEWHRRILDSADVFGARNVIPNFVAGVEMAEPFGFTTVDEAIASTTEGLRFFMSHGITPRFTTWCPEPTTPLGKTNPDGAPLEYHIRLLDAYRSTMEEYGLSSPPGYGPAGPGKAVFSVSSFMDSLPAQG